MSNAKSRPASRRDLLVRSGLALGGLAALSLADAAPARPAATRRDQVLVDQKAIEDVLVRYATAIDGHDWQALDEVFAAEATAFYGMPARSSGGRQLSISCARPGITMARRSTR